MNFNPLDLTAQPLNFGKGPSILEKWWYPKKRQICFLQKKRKKSVKFGLGKRSNISLPRIGGSHPVPSLSRETGYSNVLGLPCIGQPSCCHPGSLPWQKGGTPSPLLHQEMLITSATLEALPLHQQYHPSCDILPTSFSPLRPVQGATESCLWPEAANAIFW